MEFLVVELDRADDIACRGAWFQLRGRAECLSRTRGTATAIERMRIASRNITATSMYPSSPVRGPRRFVATRIITWRQITL